MKNLNGQYQCQDFWDGVLEHEDQSSINLKLPFIISFDYCV